LFIFFLSHFAFSQRAKSINNKTETVSSADTLINDAEDLTLAAISAKEITIHLDNPEELELALKKIHTYKNLESVTLEGNADAVEKVLYRLSVLKNLTKLTLKNNELGTVPENINQLKTLQSLTVEENKTLDYNDLFSKLSKTQITELTLNGNDLKKSVPDISKILSLKKVSVSGSDQLNYEEFVEDLSKLPALTDLAIPVNFITELPKNIIKLKSLQLLDVSNNVLTEMPDEVSSLKAINNLNIQGNLLLNPVKDLEKFKGNRILYLALDKELSGDEIEQIRKMFPEAEINFPSENHDEDESDSTLEENKSAPKPIYNGELHAKKINSILSSAYLSYPALFQGLLYNFDTLSFEERYKNFRYSNTYQKVPARAWNAGDFYFRKSLNFGEKPGKKNETWFRLGLNYQNVIYNYPELRAFYGMYWVYQGDLSKSEFRKKYLWRRKAIVFSQRIKWSDVRVEFDKNNSMFVVSVKADTGFEKFNAYPLFPNMPLEKCQQTYNKRFQMYQKLLLKRTQDFQKNQQKNKKSYDASYTKMQEYAWNELKLRMSDEEKLMTKDEWLEYYDNVVANEQKALNNSALALGYVQRGLTIKGFGTNFNPEQVNKYGYKTFNVDFIDAEGGGNLAVANIIMIDVKSKSYFQTAGTLGLLPNPVAIRQFSPYILLLELRNGNFGVVTSEEIEKKAIDTKNAIQLKAKIYDKNLNTVGEVFAGSGL
jgi:hypothetical protein